MVSPVAPPEGEGPTLRQLGATAAASALYLYMPMLSVALPLKVTAAAGVPTWTIAACFLANTVGVMALQRRTAARVSTERRARHAVLVGGLLRGRAWDLGYRLAGPGGTAA